MKIMLALASTLMSAVSTLAQAGAGVSSAKAIELFLTKMENLERFN